MFICSYNIGRDMPKTSSEENYFNKLPEDLQEKIKDMSGKIKFFDTPVAYGDFFKENKLFKYGNDIEIKLTGKSGVGVALRVSNGNIYYLHDETTDIKTYYLMYKDKEANTYHNDIITSFTIKNYNSQEVLMTFDRETMETNNDPMLFIQKTSSGGRKASVKKEVCGKLRCIYTIAGSRKEHIKYKGQLIAVSDYKKLMKKA